MCPSGVILPTVPAPDSVNHRFPSGPATIWYGRLPGEGTVNSVTRLRGAAPAVLPGIDVTAATARAAANTFRRCFMSCSLQAVRRRTIPQERPVDRVDRSGAASGSSFALLDDEGAVHLGRVNVALEVIGAGRQGPDLVVGGCHPRHELAGEQALRPRVARRVAGQDVDVVQCPSVLVVEGQGERRLGRRRQAGLVE